MNKGTPGKSEKLLADPEMAVNLLGSVSQIINVINTKRIRFDARMDKILWIILEYLGVEQGSIMVLGKGKYLEVVAASKPEIVGFRQSLEEDTVATWVVKNKEPLFIPDISKDIRFQKRGSKYKKNSLLSAPVLSENQVVGVINVTDKSGNKDFFKDDIAYLLNFSSVILWLVLQQRLLDELKKQKNTLRKRNSELRRQEKARAELAKMLIHDLKGPLSEVIANLDVLSYYIADGENAQFLESAQVGCERAEQMVSNLGSIDKIEDGKLKLIKEKVDPETLLQESLSSIKGLAKIKNIELVHEKSGTLFPLIQLDRVLILRVLQNLLSNGIGHSPAGTKITIGCKAVPQKKRIEFYVHDQGPGVPLSKQKSIFEKYFRVSHKQDSLIGSGLGLYFSRLAVEEHRGKIWVESSPGQGSRFCFSLPLH